MNYLKKFRLLWCALLTFGLISVLVLINSLYDYREITSANTNSNANFYMNFASFNTNSLSLNTIWSRIRVVAQTKNTSSMLNQNQSDLYQNLANKKLIQLQRIIDGVKNIRNVPEYPYIMGDFGQLLNASCAPFPTLFDIRFTNTYWQSQTASTWIFHMLSAYWDNRELNKGGPSIRVLGILDGKIENLEAYCQIWFANETKPTIVQVNDFENIWPGKNPPYRKGNGFIPYIWNCPNPIKKDLKVPPVSVSVVQNKCDQGTNNLKIHFQKPKKREVVAICVRAMNFPYNDISIRLVEWLEIVKLFGVHKVFLYDQNLHANISKVVDYYRRSGFVDVVKISFPVGLPNEVSLSEAFDLTIGMRHWFSEVLPLNDCLYRNLYNYEYIAYLDVDEFIVPTNLLSWPTLIRELKDKHRSQSMSFRFLNTVFHAELKLDSDALKVFGIPSYLNILPKIFSACSHRPNSAGTKSLSDPLRVKTLHNHYAFKCLGIPSCKHVYVDPTYADVHHYRFGHLQDKFCDNDTFVIDMTLWQWKNEIIQNSSHVLRELNLI